MGKYSNSNGSVSAQPRFHQRAAAIQPYGTVNHALPLELEEPVRLEMTERLNQLLADTITLRDLYKKSHWQVAGATFYQLHLPFDKHYEEQVGLVDSIAERVQLLGGVSLAMAADVAETTQIERPPPRSRGSTCPIVTANRCTSDRHSRSSDVSPSCYPTW
jgi:starvation-inducible DNA-binding protein